jgi:hypothetical protein
MRDRGAVSFGLVLCGMLASAGCGSRFVGRVSRDGAVPAVEAGIVEAGIVEAGMDVGVDGGGGADGPPLPPPNLPPVCTVDGWCWTHPLPSGDRFVDAFKVAPDDVWLVGAAGTIVRVTGGNLSTIPSPTSALAAIWATGSDDVWVGGPDGQYRWDGHVWTYRPLETNPTVRGVSAFWGCAANDIWAVGSSTARWDGSRWASVSVPGDAVVSDGSIRAVWGSACDDVWAGSLRDSSGTGAIYHFDGSVWTKREERPAAQIAGIGGSHVWSLAQGRLFHSNGVEAGALVSDDIVSLCQAGAAEVAVMNDAHQVSVVTGEGATPLSAPAPDAARTLRGSGANDLWAVGALGTAAHWTGASWERHLPAWVLSGDDATRVTGSGPDDLWAVAGATLLRRDGAAWQIALTAGDVGGQILDIWSPGRDEVWVLGNDNLVHRRVGGSWTTMNPLGGNATTPRMRAISGTGPKDVWIVRGSSTVLHWDGEGWVGREAVVYYGGGLNAVNAIWAAAPDDLWAVGDVISHWSNGAWVAPPQFPSNIVGINGPYVAVAGTGPNDVHLLLASGYVAKATNNNLTLVEELTSTTHPIALAAAVPTGVWAVFDDPVGGVSRIYRLGGDPDAGAAPRLVGPAGLSAIWSAPDGTLWAAGKGGSLLRRAPSP